jgi:hypothetical protein
MRLLRVFPARTKGTPDDELSFVGDPPALRPAADEVHISVTFTWHRAEAERLRAAWSHYYSVVKVGGPAYDDSGGEFVPGRYVKQGYTITTRGCPNACDFCFVPQREGSLRCLPIRPGWNVLDNNLLAAPRGHIERVLDMLVQYGSKTQFTGGLEAARLEEWFVQAITAIRFKRLFLAYDRPQDRKDVAQAISLIRHYGHRRDKIACYVLVGYAGDTQGAALARVQFIKDAGGTPFAMYYQDRDSGGRIAPEWQPFIREWCRAASINRTIHTEELPLFEGTTS